MKTSAYKTPHEIARRGFAALVEKLGPGGALQFLHQYETGQGDYAAERRRLFGKTSLAEIRKQLARSAS